MACMIAINDIHQMVLHALGGPAQQIFLTK